MLCLETLAQVKRSFAIQFIHISAMNRIQRQALVIGINRYPGLRKQNFLPHLDKPAKDAEAIAQQLEAAPRDLMWSIQRLPEDLKADQLQIADKESVNADQLKKAITQLFCIEEYSSTPDVALLFFSGHGLRQKKGDNRYEGYLATSDSNAQDNWGISLNWLRGILLKSPIKKQIILLDCCHSGELLNFTEFELEEWQQLSGNRCLIAACKEDKVAFSHDKHGVLTQALLQAINPQSYPQGQWITSGTITEFIEQQLEHNPLLRTQIPLCKNWGERIRFWPGQFSRIPNPQSWQEKYSLNQHSDGVQAVAISPNGKMLATGSVDTTIKIWDMMTGEFKHTLTGYTSTILSLAFSPDNQTLASSSNLEVRDSTVKLWDVSSGKLQRHLEPSLLACRVSSVAFSPDGQFLATGQIDTTIKIWHLATGKSRQTLRGHGWDVTSVNFSRDGRLLISGAMDGAVKVWDWSTGQLKHTFNRPKPSDFMASLVSWFDSSIGPIWSVAIHPNGHLIASGGSDQGIRFWDLKTGQLTKTIAAHNGTVYTVAFSPDGETLASGGNDNQVSLWDVQTGELLCSLPHFGSVKSVAFSPNGKFLVSGSLDKTVKIWQRML